MGLCDTCTVLYMNILTTTLTNASTYYHARPLLTGMATQGRLHVGVVEEWTNTATGADMPTLTHQTRDDARTHSAQPLPQLRGQLS